MSGEEIVQQELIRQFNYLDGKVVIPRKRRIFVDVPLENFNEVISYGVKELKFAHLCSITGLDEGERLSAVYHWAQDNGIMMNIKVSVPKDKPVLKSISALFPSAEMYERELVDLLGFTVEGLPEGFRYPLPDHWPEGQFPLRKDWKPQG